MRARPAGFTLLELLIGLLALGILFALVAAWQSTTLRLSARAGTQATGLQALGDLTGYLGDRVRAAVRVRVATSGLRLNGRDCTPGAPCLALVLPDEGEARYLLYVYRLDPRALVAAADKREDPWAETHARALREYRSTAPGTAGSSLPASCAATPATFAAACPALANLDALATLGRFQPYLVADDLAPDVSPFAFDPATRTVTLRFQLRQRVQGDERRLPPGEPLTLGVQARNM